MEFFSRHAMAISNPRAHIKIIGVVEPVYPRAIYGLIFYFGTREILAKGNLQVHVALLDRDRD